MADYNIFELCGGQLTFDPPEESPKKVRNAIEATQKKLEAKKRDEWNYLPQYQRDDLVKTLKQLEAAAIDLFPPDGKGKKLNTEIIREMAAKQMEAAKRELESSIAIEKRRADERGAERIATVTMVRTFSRVTRISQENVEKALVSNGFKIDTLKTLDNLHFEMAKKVSALLERFRSVKVNPAFFGCPAGVQDLYDFCAYLDDVEQKSKIGSGYQMKTAEQLHNKSQEYRQQDAPLDQMKRLCAAAAGDTSKETELNSLTKTIGSLGSKIFENKENQFQYNLYLKYYTEDLKQLFNHLRSNVPKESRNKPETAEWYVQDIARHVDSMEHAIELYNEEAEITDDPYLGPYAPVYTVKCATCQRISKFSSRNEAMRINRCTNPDCGKELYRKCPKCQSMVLRTLDTCSECYFPFASAGLFNQYYRQAENEIQRGNFEKAKDLIVKAESTDPGEKTRIGEIKARLAKAEMTFGAPIHELNALILQKKFQAAGQYVANTIAVKYPNLDVSEQLRQINSVLNKCAENYNAIKNSPKASKINGCLDILVICSDFNEALSFLRSSAATPDPAAMVTSTVDAEKGTITVSWRGTGERGVKYILVKKQGKMPPGNISDGKTVLSESDSLLYEDNDIIPGTTYSYSVFASRMGVYATPKSITAAVAVKVKNAVCKQRGKRISITWVTPPQCLGVEVYRTSDGKKVLLSSNARNDYEDANVQYNVLYNYSLVAVYAGGQKSEETHVSHTLTPEIKEFTISCTKAKGTIYSVTWSIKEPGINLQIIVNGQIFTCKSEDKSMVLNLAANQQYSVFAKAFSGGAWVESSNSVDNISTYPSYEVEITNDTVREKVLPGHNAKHRIEWNIKLKGEITDNVVGFVYFIRTKETAPSMWVEPDQIMDASDRKQCGVNNYRQNGYITTFTDAKNEETYYLTLYTVYNTGNGQALSAPYKKKINRPLDVLVRWHVDRPFFGKRQITLVYHPNRPMTRTPQIVLCESRSSHSPKNLNDPEAIVVLSIPEQYHSEPISGTYEETYTVEKGSKNAKLYLFECEKIQGETFDFREQ